jgi:hypothetical protein
LFSDEQLLAGVRAVGESVGHAPSGGDYDRFAKPLGLASLGTVYLRFGHWYEVLEAAGFERVAPRRSYRRRWDERACWEALERVSGELGELPRYRGYERLAAAREDLPSGALLRRRLGPWSRIAAALRERRGGGGVPEVVHAAA